MTLYTWGDIRNELTTAYNTGPGATLEQDILTHFHTNPAQVISTGRAVAKDYAAGKANNPWGALRYRLNQAAARSDITAEDSGPRDRATRNAEQWLRTAGMHFDRWDEVEDELFTNGTLRHWRDDTNLHQHIETLWLELRPTGEALDAAEIERANKWKNTHPHGSAHRLEQATLATPPTAAQ